MNPPMSIFDVRKKRTLLLIDKCFAGKKSELAATMGVQATQISRLFMSTKNKRRIAERFARQIEAAAGVRKYWLDQDDDEDLAHVNDGAIMRRLTPDEWHLVAAYRRVPDEQRPSILKFIRTMRRRQR